MANSKKLTCNLSHDNVTLFFVYHTRLYLFTYCSTYLVFIYIYHHHSAIVRLRTVSVSLLIAFLPMLYKFSSDHVMILSNHLYRLLPLFPFPRVFPSIVVRTRHVGLLFQWQYLLIFLCFTYMC